MRQYINIGQQVETNTSGHMVRGLHNLPGYVKEVRICPLEGQLYLIQFYTVFRGVPVKREPPIGWNIMECCWLKRNCFDLI